jgi:MYXO-CTERM domain-containing protein
VYFNRIAQSVVASLAMLFCAAPALATVSLTITDNDATPGSTIVGAGQTFNFTVNLVSTAEQTTGLDYYLTTPNGDGFFSIVDRNTAGSTFVDPLFFNDATVEGAPSNLLNPRNDHDLGALATATTNAGTHLVANFTMLVSAAAPNGIYTIQTTTAQPTEGWIDPSSGEHPFNSHGTFSISVPEPGAGAAAALVALGALVRRRRHGSRLIP